MVCNRCIAAVKSALDELKLQYTSLDLGEITVKTIPADKQLDAFKEKLSHLGFELLDDARKKLIEKIKTIIIEHVQPMHSKSNC